MRSIKTFPAMAVGTGIFGERWWREKHMFLRSFHLLYIQNIGIFYSFVFVLFHFDYYVIAQWIFLHLPIYIRCWKKKHPVCIMYNLYMLHWRAFNYFIIRFLHTNQNGYVLTLVLTCIHIALEFQRLNVTWISKMERQ